MTGEEMENLFSTLYNNINSNLAPGLDSYEISLFLTKALDELVKAYFTAITNKELAGFDDNERRQMDFSRLIRTKKITSVSIDNLDTLSPDTIESMFGYKSGVFYFLADTTNDRIMYILNESLLIGHYPSEYSTSAEKWTYYAVVPLLYTQLINLMSKPYKRPIKGLAWRIINAGDAIDTSNPSDGIYDSASLTFEIIAHPKDSKTPNLRASYIMRYVARPCAIRTRDFDNEVTIDGGSDAQDCELDPSLHEEIVLRAVELAKASYGGSNDLLAMILAGNQSATEKGILTKQS